MKLLFDFDGVLTDPTHEAARVEEIFRRELSVLGKTSEGVIDRLFATAERSFASTPWRYGWVDQGRLSAFCNEDPFIRTNAVAALFDQWEADGDSVLGEIRGLIQQKDFKSFQALGAWSFQQMARESASGVFEPLDLEAVRAVEAAASDRAWDVVVVSSSSTARIENMLKRAGVGSRIRVRGDAKKYVLGAEANHFEAGQYSIDTNRPHYLRILEEEKPDVVVGDVFSLDLTLPLSLWRGQVEGFEGLRLFLRKRHYTPKWSEEFCLEAARSQSAPLATIASIPEWIGNL